MIEFDYSDFTITVLAAEIEEEVLRVKNLEAAIDDLPEARDRLAALKAEMAKRVSPEQPTQPSTETMADEIEGTPAPMPVKPLTDLTGVGCAPAFEGYQPNGALPETD